MTTNRASERFLFVNDTVLLALINNPNVLEQLDTDCPVRAAALELQAALSLSDSLASQNNPPFDASSVPTTPPRASGVRSSRSFSLDDATPSRSSQASAADIPWSALSPKSQQALSIFMNASAEALTHESADETVTADGSPKARRGRGRRAAPPPPPPDDPPPPPPPPNVAGHNWTEDCARGGKDGKKSKNKGARARANIEREWTESVTGNTKIPAACTSLLNRFANVNPARYHHWLSSVLSVGHIDQPTTETGEQDIVALASSYLASVQFSGSTVASEFWLMLSSAECALAAQQVWKDNDVPLSAAQRIQQENKARRREESNTKAGRLSAKRKRTKQPVPLKARKDDVPVISDLYEFLCAQAPIAMGTPSQHGQKAFRDAYDNGLKYLCLIAGAGIPGLVLAAGLGLRQKINKLLINEPRLLADALRNPVTGTSVGSIITNRIIPAVADMQASMQAVWELARPFHGLKAVSRLQDSDNLTSHVLLRDWALRGRDPDAWQPVLDGNFPCNRVLNVARALSGVRCGPTYEIPLLEEEFNYPAVQVFETSFDRQHERNTTYTVSSDRQRAEEKTERNRKRALQAVVPSSANDLRKELLRRFAGGYRESGSSYLKIPAHITEPVFRLNNSDGSLMAWVCRAMGERMRTTLFATLQIALGRLVALQNVDSQQTGNTLFHFLVWHFSLYNRHATQGTGAPKTVHPENLRRSGVKTNISQALPYASADMREFRSVYEELEVVFQDLFAWVRQTLHHYLKDEMNEIVISIERLPGSQSSPTAPFAGLVVNVNVITRMHRDKKDKKFCCIIALGDWEGGDLCFYEQGLVFPLRSGDLIVFRSSETTHFNLHFRGRRASLVLHTDRELDAFEDNDNHWGDHLH
ncbi:unnamed protein product [Peniophora sp. CBMAI 1063]|nr:unnamed protein product [Peniophora sp. CBMAI 1063]